MTKYLVTWEINADRVPLDPKERGAMWGGMLAAIKQQMSEGVIADWGAFTGENRGYAVANSSALELTKQLQPNYPYVIFEVHEVMSVDEAGEFAKSLSEG